MTLVWAMLVASLVPTGHPRWLFATPEHMTEGATRPALCFFDYSFLPETGYYAVTTSGFGIIWLGWSVGLVTITFLRRLYELGHSPAALRKREALLDHLLSSEFKQKSGRRAKFMRWGARVWAFFGGFRTNTLAKFTEYMDIKTKQTGIAEFLWSGLREASTTVLRLLESFVWHVSTALR